VRSAARSESSQLAILAESTEGGRWAALAISQV
jgi:hypothetical protein